MHFLRERVHLLEDETLILIRLMDEQVLNIKERSQFPLYSLLREFQS